VLESYLRSRGSGALALYRPAGGTRIPLMPGQVEVENTKLYMDGRAVYRFAVGAIIEVVDALLGKAGLSIDDVDHVVPHQANVRIIDAACKRAGYPPEKFFTNLADYANTSAASIPIALDELVATNKLKRDQTVITVGFGAGLTYGGNLIRW
jgi:3-oxoacyl-[acyl-carrier-protein] synthase-3